MLRFLDPSTGCIDAVDAQILELLAQRAGFVREATRFKGKGERSGF